MKPKKMRAQAGDPRFIPGIYNYCDRWCERCPLSNRCLTYAMEQEDDDGDPVARDLSNEKFWQKLQEQFQNTLEMLQQDAKARGIDLNDPKLEAKAKARERAERRLAAKNRPLTRDAMAYTKAAEAWFKEARPLFTAKGVELDTLERLETGNPQAEAAELSELVEVIRWYQHFIYVKLCRAVDSGATEELDRPEVLKAYPKDSDGSAKIALIAIDRSIEAWASLRIALGGEAEDTILDLLAQLAAIRREAEKVFPHARAFVRPGFDLLPRKP